MCLRILCLLLFFAVGAQAAPNLKILPGASRMDQYLPLLQGRRVALLINQTSRVEGRLLSDTLRRRGIDIVKIFTPEHGFQGTADAGASVGDSRDLATGVPVISLYGSNKMPTEEQLNDVDWVVYDVQDVGARFYTYISTLQYLMEACAAYNKPLLLLDRPNPNGNYVDGPVLDTSLRSFVGMQPIPIVYGMTPGEYARMLVGERWFPGAENLRLEVIPCFRYSHRSSYELPVPPSPNLRSMEAIYLYPTLCLFEGTSISVGRGTDKPFEQWGSPALKGTFSYTFKPRSLEGATHPPHEGKTCYGRKATEEDVLAARKGLRIEWILEMLQALPEKERWTNGNFFEKLYGRNDFEKNGKLPDAASLRASWQPGLQAFKRIRAKYLIYPDFE
ncbi:MAG: DUF1343 domain-containing protein [Bacteroidetes bacterium]|nr:DUF1343 domain-containing protein [Bacteroidota bacterium]